mgnify:CR=1 FL=1
MMDTQQTIVRLVEIIKKSLQEIRDAENGNLSDFALGQVYAYMDCLEVLKACPEFYEVACFMEKLISI